MTASSGNWIVAGLLMAACSQGSGRPDGAGGGDGATGGGDGAAGGGGEADDDSACLPARLGLVNAHLVASYEYPTGCTLQAQPSQGEIVRVTSEEEFRGKVQCPAGTGSGIDFAAHELRIMARMSSPANVGVDVWDDGAKLTMVDRFREPCQPGPLPMPMTSTFQFLLPVGATRTTANTHCTIRPHCN